MHGMDKKQITFAKMPDLNERKRKALAAQKIANNSMGPGQRSKIANDQQASTDRSVGKMYNLAPAKPRPKFEYR